MLVSEEIASKFAELLLDLSIQTAIKAHKYIEDHERIKGFYKYPIKTVTFPKDEDKFAELFELVPFLKYDIPKYYMDDFPSDQILYVSAK